MDREAQEATVHGHKESYMTERARVRTHTHTATHSHTPRGGPVSKVPCPAGAPSQPLRAGLGPEKWLSCVAGQLLGWAPSTGR